MEHFFGLQFDFENSSGASPPLEDNSLQEDNYLYEEINQGAKRAYQCTFPGCGKTFKYKSEMNRHSVIHQEERPYCCTFGDCKKNFKRPDALENHMRIHLGNLPFACDFPGCDKRFATKAAIRYHRIRHNNERIYKCEISGCGKSFLTPSQLKQHQRACNLHYGFSPVKVEDEPIKHVKIEQKNPNENFLKTESQSTNHIQWEVKTQTCEDETQGQMTPKQFEMIFSYLMNENKILKGQLHEREKFTNVNEKKLKVEHQSDIQVDFTPVMEPSSFFDDNELKFLEFLKGRENVSF